MFDKVARKYNIPVDLVKAIIQVESSNQMWAVRYEPNYRWLYKPEYFAKSNHIPQATEEALQKTSWGLTQIMGAVAREYGFGKRFLTELLCPEVSLEYGMRHFAAYHRRFGNLEDAIASYNGGPGAVFNKKEVYPNQQYVNRVSKAWKGER